MGDIAVHVEGLGKKYQVGAGEQRHKSMRDFLAYMATAPIRRVRNVVRGRGATGQTSTFWALDDLSFDVKRGEVLGVIGRNGAGKTTLLKILSRITEPTKGFAEIHGRVGALLEVGTGFHEELTGRENVYMNAAILGMQRRETNRKFEEIVSFAEVEKFIDTPVKHYSSGMKLRLGFAVAAHLEPEILIADEVLAVGDLAFQEKCLGKMSDVASSGRTVLFVSHNMGAIAGLCTRCILLNHGKLEFEGSTSEAISRYISATVDADEAAAQASKETIFIRSLCLPGNEGNAVPFDQPFTAEATVEVREPIESIATDFVLRDAENRYVLHTRVDSKERVFGGLGVGTYRLRVDIPKLWLASGVYTAQFKIHAQDQTGYYSRFLSPHLPVSLTGKHLNKSSVLYPSSDWSMTPQSRRAPEPT